MSPLLDRACDLMIAAMRERPRPGTLAGSEHAAADVYATAILKQVGPELLVLFREHIGAALVTGIYWERARVQAEGKKTAATGDVTSGDGPPAMATDLRASGLADTVAPGAPAGESGVPEQGVERPENRGAGAGENGGDSQGQNDRETCRACADATGGVCAQHQVECACYELTGGHEPGCAFSRPLNRPGAP